MRHGFQEVIPPGDCELQVIPQGSKATNVKARCGAPLVINGKDAKPHAENSVEIRDGKVAVRNPGKMPVNLALCFDYEPAGGKELSQCEELENKRREEAQKNGAEQAAEVPPVPPPVKPARAAKSPPADPPSADSRPADPQTSEQGEANPTP